MSIRTLKKFSKLSQKRVDYFQDGKHFKFSPKLTHTKYSTVFI